jgi:hypothetical protein
MTDKMALERVLVLVKAREDDGGEASEGWMREHEGTLWVLEGLLEALENDE